MRRVARGPGRTVSGCLRRASEWASESPWRPAVWQGREALCPSRAGRTWAGRFPRDSASYFVSCSVK